MANTIADIIAEVRLELDDALSTRWTDLQLIRMIGKAFRRINHILYRNDIELGRYVETITVQSGDTSFALPYDFLVDSALFRDDTHERLEKMTEDEWLSITSAPELSTYIIRGDFAFVADIPEVERSLTLIYWPQVQTSDLDEDTPSPYGGKLDDLVVEYAALRCKNIDEMDASTDMQLMQDLENNVLNTFSAITPTTISRRGWLV